MQCNFVNKFTMKVPFQFLVEIPQTFKAFNVKKNRIPFHIIVNLVVEIYRFRIITTFPKENFQLYCTANTLITQLCYNNFNCRCAFYTLKVFPCKTFVSTDYLKGSTIFFCYAIIISNSFSIWICQKSDKTDKRNLQSMLYIVELNIFMN